MLLTAYTSQRLVWAPLYPRFQSVLNSEQFLSSLRPGNERSYTGSICVGTVIPHKGFAMALMLNAILVIHGWKKVDGEPLKEKTYITNSVSNGNRYVNKLSEDEEDASIYPKALHWRVSIFHSPCSAYCVMRRFYT